MIDASARNLMVDMASVQDAMKHMTASDLGKLLSARYKSRLSLQAFMNHIDDQYPSFYNVNTEHFSFRDIINARSAKISTMVSNHIARWSPVEISKDLDSYYHAVCRIQAEIRSFVYYSTIPRK